MVEDGEEMDGYHPFEAQQTMIGVNERAA